MAVRKSQTQMKTKLLTFLLGSFSLWAYAQADITENFDGAVFPQPGWSVVNATVEVLNASKYPEQGNGLKFDQYNESITTPPICNVSYIYFKTIQKVPLKVRVQEVGNPTNTIEIDANTNNGNTLVSWGFNLGAQPSFVGKIVTITFITVNDGSNSGFAGSLDDIRIVRAASPEIDVDGYGFPIADNSTTLDTESGTDFGRQVIGDTEKVQRFTIKNTGAQNLTVTSVSLTGTHASSFRLVAFSTNTLNPNFNQTSLPITVLPNNEIYVYVAFSPTSLGTKSATLNISSNDCDEQFYDFSIAGTAVECKLKNVLLFQNTFESGQNTSSPNYLPVAAGSSTLAYNPKANTNDTSQWYPVNTPLYSPSKNTLTGVAGSRALLVSNETKTFTFGPVNISSYNNVAVSFEMAGISKTSSEGLDGDDMVKLYISSDGGVTWSYEAMIKGAYDKSPNIKSNLKFPFSDADAHTNDRNYDGNNKEYYWGNIDNSIAGVTNNELGTFVLSIPDQKKPNQIMIRLVVNTTNANEVWMIDNVQVVQRGTPITKIWKGAWYDDNNTPTSEGASLQHRVLVEENYNSDVNGNLLACKCEINAGKSLVIKGDQYAKVVGDITNNGTLTVENDGNLIQISDDAQFLGTNPIALVKRNASLKRLDYNYWGAPVENQNLKNFSPGTHPNRYYTYVEATDLFQKVNATTTSFQKGVGYAIRAYDNYTTGQVNLFEGQFTGKPNNGVIEVDVLCTSCTPTARGYNLIGNPYASNIDFEALYNLNKNLIYQTFYVWTNTNYNPEMQGANYPQNLPTGTNIVNNYAVYNGTGGVGAPYGFDPSKPVVKNDVNKFIRVGQGFIVKAKTAGKLKFNNSVRTPDASAVFYNKKMAYNADEKDRFWLNLKTPLNFVSTILVGYIDGASDDFELDYDAEHLVVGGDSFYSLIEDKKIVIQGKKKFSDTDKVLLGASFGLEGTYTISLEKAEGTFAKEQAIFLKDKLTNEIVNLKETDYTFTAKSGEVKDRFELVYKNAGILSTNENNVEEIVKVYKKAESVFEIKSIEKLQKVNLIDVSGKLLKSYQPKTSTFEMNISGLPKGMYIVQAKTANAIYTKKILKQ